MLEVRRTMFMDVYELFYAFNFPCHSHIKSQYDKIYPLHICLGTMLCINIYARSDNPQTENVFIYTDGTLLQIFSTLIPFYNVGGWWAAPSVFFCLFSNSCWQRRFILLQCFECIIYVGIDVLYTYRKKMGKKKENHCIIKKLWKKCCDEVKQ